YVSNCLVQTVRAAWADGYDNATIPTNPNAHTWNDLTTALHTHLHEIPIPHTTNPHTDPLHHIIDTILDPTNNNTSATIIIDDGTTAHGYYITHTTDTNGHPLALIHDTNTPTHHNPNHTPTQPPRIPRIRTHHQWKQTYPHIHRAFITYFHTTHHGTLQPTPPPPHTNLHGTTNPIQGPPSETLDPERVDIAGLQDAMRAGRVTSAELVQTYLNRIRVLNDEGPRLNAIRMVNPHALRDAERLDAERRRGRVRGPLHGVPVLVKDNIDVAGMPTTAGALALRDSVPAVDSFLVQRLREAGAVILGKTNLTEFANFTTTGMPNGYSGLGGQVVNPYNSDLDPSGSSSGSAVAAAAALAAVTIGTETFGSIISPASANSLVGVKPTIGLLSRTGILPISADQDTPGPMTRSVYDAAALFTVLAGSDPEDPATADAAGVAGIDYTAALSVDALRGKRIGVVATDESGNMLNAFTNAQSVLTAQGATLVPVTVRPPTFGPVLPYGFKRDINRYLARLPADAPMRSLDDIVRFNRAHAAEGTIEFGHSLLVESNAVDLDDPQVRAEYETNRDTGVASAQHVIDSLLSEHQLDALVFIHNSCWPVVPRSRYPAVAVPIGYDPGTGRPFGMTLVGTAFTEAPLLGMAYAYEQAAQAWRPPTEVNSALVSGTESNAAALQQLRAHLASARTTRAAVAELLGVTPELVRPGALQQALSIDHQRISGAAVAPAAVAAAAGPLLRWIGARLDLHHRTEAATVAAMRAAHADPAVQQRLLDENTDLDNRLTQLLGLTSPGPMGRVSGDDPLAVLRHVAVVTGASEVRELVDAVNGYLDRDNGNLLVPTGEPLRAWTIRVHAAESLGIAPHDVTREHLQQLARQQNSLHSALVAEWGLWLGDHEFEQRPTYAEVAELAGVTERFVRNILTRTEPTYSEPAQRVLVAARWLGCLDKFADIVDPVFAEQRFVPPCFVAGEFVPGRFTAQPRLRGITRTAGMSDERARRILRGRAGRDQETQLRDLLAAAGYWYHPAGPYAPTAEAADPESPEPAPTATDPNHSVPEAIPERERLLRWYRDFLNDHSGAPRQGLAEHVEMFRLEWSQVRRWLTEAGFDTDAHATRPSAEFPAPDLSGIAAWPAMVRGYLGLTPADLDALVDATPGTWESIESGGRSLEVEHARALLRRVPGARSAYFALLDHFDELLTKFYDPAYPEGYPHIGAYIRFLRESRGRSRAWLGRELGKSADTVKHWENGQYSPPKEAIHRLLELLPPPFGVTLDEIAEVYSYQRQPVVFPNPLLSDSLGEYVRHLRTRNNLTRADTATITGIPEPTLQVIENEKSTASEPTALKFYRHIVAQAGEDGPGAVDAAALSATTWNELAAAWGYDTRLDPVADTVPDPETYDTVHQWMRALRRYFQAQSGMTRSEFAAQAGRSVRSIRAMEKDRKPRLIVLRTLRDNLGFSPDMLQKVLRRFYSRPEPARLDPAIEQLFWDLIATRPGSTEEHELQNRIFHSYKWIPQVMARRWTNARVDRQDLEQAATEAVLRAIKAFVPVDDFAAVAWASAFYATLRFTKANATDLHTLRDLWYTDTADETSGDAEAAFDFRVDLQRAVSGLPAGETIEQILLKLLEGYTFEEIGAEHGLAPETVRDILLEAADSLRETLSEDPPPRTNSSQPPTTTPWRRPRTATTGARTPWNARPGTAGSTARQPDSSDSAESTDARNVVPPYVSNCLVQTVRAAWADGYDNATIPTNPNAHTWNDLTTALHTHLHEI
ncbi:amidase family protein, partial [Nocardia wallacei]|uniref:amidase family protein n=1 Tax=Nocardia wallacei TaxID=480035 RepID=UPI002455C92E